MLVNMSNQYRRPLLTFYLSAPPKTGDRGQDFKTLPATVVQADNALVDAVRRNIRARQSLVRMALEEEDETESLPFIGTAEIDETPGALASRMKATLDFDIATYRRSRTMVGAVSYLRDQAEGAGIFVLFMDNLGSYHTEIPIDLFWGFALADDIAPFVAANANDSIGARAFTVVHELAHLWLGLTGVSGRKGERRIEKFCNDVAGEFLLPATELTRLAVSEDSGLAAAVQQVGDFARAHKVSGTMVAYKLHRSGTFSHEFYEGIARTFRENFFARRSLGRNLARRTGSGPAYPSIRRHRAGPALVELADRMLRAGVLTTTKAGNVLGVSAKNVQNVL